MYYAQYTRVAPSSAIARQFPNALDYDWYFIAKDGVQSGPYIFSYQEIQEYLKGEYKVFRCLTTRPTVVLSYKEVEQRYPRLIKLLRWKFCLITVEASACIRDYLRGHRYSCEAVSQGGRTTTETIVNTVKTRAIRHRLPYLKVK